jgi:hypothetical protein
MWVQTYDGAVERMIPIAEFIREGDSRLSNARTPTTHTHLWADITDKPTTFAPSGHTHTKSQITDFAHTHLWADITDKPTTFAPTTHTHLWADITDKPTTFAPTTHTHLWADITDRPTTFTPSTHSHGIADVMGLQANLDAKSNTGHIHDDRYYTETESDAKYAVVNHTHSNYALATHTHSEYAGINHTHSEYVNTSEGYGTSLIKTGNMLKSITVNPANVLLTISEAYDTIEIGAKTDAANHTKFYRGDGTFQTIEGMTSAGVVWANTVMQTGFVTTSDIMRSYFGGGSSPIFNGVIPVLIGGAYYYIPAYKQ